MEAEYLQGQMIMDAGRGTAAKDLDCCLKGRECAAAVVLRSEEVAFDRHRDTRPARRTRFLTISGEPSDKSSRASTLSPLQKGAIGPLEGQSQEHRRFPLLSASEYSAGKCCIYHTSSLDIARRLFGRGFPARARGSLCRPSG